jgi:hypothetical protein
LLKVCRIGVTILKHDAPQTPKSQENVCSLVGENLILHYYFNGKLITTKDEF